MIVQHESNSITMWNCGLIFNKNLKNNVQYAWIWQVEYVLKLVPFAMLQCFPCLLPCLHLFTRSHLLPIVPTPFHWQWIAPPIHGDKFTMLFLYSSIFVVSLPISGPLQLFSTFFPTTPQLFSTYPFLPWTESVLYSSTIHTRSGWMHVHINRLILEQC